MAHLIDPNKSVFELTKEHPELIPIMKEIGFESITTPGMLNTAGRFMTLPKGSAMKKIPMEQIQAAFLEHGYQILDKE